eukprot:3041499-Pleurochrysis_carterae.AAC.1
MATSIAPTSPAAVAGLAAASAAAVRLAAAIAKQVHAAEPHLLLLLSQHAESRPIEADEIARADAAAVALRLRVRIDVAKGAAWTPSAHLLRPVGQLRRATDVEEAAVAFAPAPHERWHAAVALWL